MVLTVLFLVLCKPRIVSSEIVIARQDSYLALAAKNGQRTAHMCPVTQSRLPSEPTSATLRCLVSKPFLGYWRLNSGHLWNPQLRITDMRTPQVRIADTRTPAGATPINDYFANFKLKVVIYDRILFQYYYDSILSLAIAALQSKYRVV
jgi:hypothetical protein